MAKNHYMAVEYSRVNETFAYGKQAQNELKGRIYRKYYLEIICIQIFIIIEWKTANRTNTHELNAMRAANIISQHSLSRNAVHFLQTEKYLLNFFWFIFENCLVPIKCEHRPKWNSILKRMK